MKNMEQYPSVKAPKKRTNKAGKVRWLARYRDLEAGKVVERSVGTYDTKKEAVDQTRKAIDELKRIRENELISSDITVKGFIDQHWKDWRSNQLVNPDHFPLFERLIQMTGFAKIKVNKINRTSLRRFWMQVESFLIENDYSNSTKVKMRANMNSLLNYAVECSFLEENMNYGLKIDSPKAFKDAKNQNAENVWLRAQKIWTGEQIMKFLPLFNNLKKKPKNVDTIMWWAFFNFGIFTGMRTGEITALKFSDIDRDKRIITIKGSVSLNKRTRELTINKPKSSSFGQIHYSKDLDPIIEALELYHITNETIDQEYLFQYRWGGLVAPDYWSSMFKRVQIQAGIPEDQILPSAHYMRHTHLSLLAHNGYSMAEIQRRARHSDPRTTAKYYVHILDERDQEMADSFSASLGINNAV